MGQKQVSSAQIAIAIVAAIIIVGGLGFLFFRGKDSGTSPYSGKFDPGGKGGPPPGVASGSGGGRPMGPPRGMMGPPRGMGGSMGGGGGAR